MAVIRKKRETVRKALGEVQLKAREEEEVKAWARREAEEKFLEEAAEGPGQKLRLLVGRSRSRMMRSSGVSRATKSQTQILSCLQRSARMPTLRRTGTTSRRTSWTSMRWPP